MDSKKDYFSSRWTFLLAALGMAIGAGNIWRFPRLAGQYGGSFLIPWLIFLFMWSIPLIMVEFSIGKKFRLGVIGAFRKGLGKKYTWMGWFVALCTIGIMFYYSVVCGWSLKYFFMSVQGSLSSLNHAQFWIEYTSNNWEPVLFSSIALISGSFIIFFGVRSGIEKAVKILIPSLFVLIIIAAIRALTLPDAGEGLKYFFRVSQDDLLNYKVWLEALSQSAWSTGAGWGLILTYSTYVKKQENIFINSAMTGIGNNIASIMVGLAVIPTVFALSVSNKEALAALQSGNQGLTFIFIPQLFEKMPGSIYFSSLFFLALFIAAISSLISMLELAVRVLMDYEISRRNAVMITAGVGLFFGIPSAYSIKFFNNQDWVWGIGLLLSGFFFIFFVLKTKISNFKSKFFEYFGNNILLHNRTLKILSVIMVLEFVLMLSWWFIQSVKWYPASWWDPFDEFTLGTCLMQWGILILIGLLFNKKISNIKS